MSGSQVSHEYVLACLDAAIDLSDALKSALGGEPVADISALTIIRRPAEGCGPDNPPPPKGEGCARAFDISTTFEFDNPAAALEAITTLVSLVRQAVASMPADGTFDVAT